MDFLLDYSMDVVSTMAVAAICFLLIRKVYLAWSFRRQSPVSRRMGPLQYRAPNSEPTGDLDLTPLWDGARKNKPRSGIR